MCQVRPHGPYTCAGISPDRGTSTFFYVAVPLECSDSPKAPNLAQQHAEYERVQSEAAQLASQLTDALAGRDSSASTATDVSQRLTKTSCENGVASETAERSRMAGSGLAQRDR